MRVNAGNLGFEEAEGVSILIGIIHSTATGIHRSLGASCSDSIQECTHPPKLDVTGSEEMLSPEIRSDFQVASLQDIP